MTTPIQTLTRIGLSALLFTGCESGIQAINPPSSGSGNSLQGTASSPASPAQVLSVSQYWDSTGTLQTGTMANQGALNAQASFPGAGYYSGISNMPVASSIASGIQILGVTGTLTSSGAGDLSNACRDVGTTQITELAEVTTYAQSNLPTGYRDVPDLLKDDDGYNNTDADPTCATDGSGCTPLVSVTLAQHTAFVDCGGTQTSVAARIADCASGGKNGSNATWNGQTNGIHGESTWSLVTHLGANQEVWQDQKTGLLWSSVVIPVAIENATGGDNWCRAAGNAQANDPNNYCNSTTNQPEYPTSAESYCAEGAGLVPVPGWCSDGNDYANSGDCIAANVGNVWTANTENYTLGSASYSTAKGGMGASSTTLAVRWRLPTKWDYQQADNDGVRSVMPDMGASPEANGEWSASLFSGNRFNAWDFNGRYGSINFNNRNFSFAVRCVGR
jgi:hypothetical protein